MMDRPEPTHTVAIEFRDQPCQMHFFKTWTGYSHPVTLRDPVGFEEVPGLKVYYEGIFSKSEDSPLLLQCTKWELKRTDWKLPPGRSTPESGNHFLACKWSEDDPEQDDPQPSPGETIPAAKASANDAFFHLKVGPSGNLVQAQLVRRQLEYRFKYEYGPEGALRRFLIEKPDDEKRVEIE